MYIGGITETGVLGTRQRLANHLGQALKSALLLIAVLISTGILSGCAGLLSGTKTAIQAAFKVNPTAVNFGNVGVGKKTTQTVSVSNTGNTSISITQAALSNPQFSLTGVTLPMTMATGQSSNLTVAVTPTTTGTVSGTLTVQGNDGSAPAVVNLSATAVASGPQISSSSSSVEFGTVAVNSQGTADLTISNTGGSDLTISVMTLTGAEFAVSGITTPKTISAGQSAPVTLTFHPTAVGTVTGSLAFTSNSIGSPLTIPVSGTGGQAVLSSTPSSAAFGSVAVGSTNSQTIRLSNTGNATLTITQATVTGSGFGFTGLTLPLSINPGQSSTFNAQFQPAVTGSVSGGITIISNAVGSPSVVALSGTGVVATELLTFSSNSLGFGNVDTGSSSTQTETITNTGNANVQISQIAISGAGYSLSGASAPVTLTPTQSLTFSIIFSPTTTGTLNGSVTVTSNATGSPSTISLSGSGVTATSHTVSLSWTASTSTVSGYNVYRSTTSGSGYAKLNGALVASVSYTDSTVQNSTTYYYVTTAVDASGSESAYSNQAPAVIP